MRRAGLILVLSNSRDNTIAISKTGKSIAVRESSGSTAERKTEIRPERIKASTTGLIPERVDLTMGLS
jgi:hypothetical protein